MIVSSRSDEASTSMGNFLLENYNFKPSDGSGNDFMRGDFLLRFIDERHLYYDRFEADAKAFGSINKRCLSILKSKPSRNSL